MEKISVIIPIYNVEKYLSRCIESIINQTYKNLEIILVDDGSTDSSGLMCNEYAKKDPRIIVIHKKNGGLSDARNSGLDIAKGEYIGFIDSDDFISFKFYKILYKTLTETNSDLIFCNYTEFYNEKDLNKTDNKSPAEKIIYSSYDILNNFYNQKYYPQHLVMWNKLFKKKIWENLRFPKGKYHEDEYVIHEIFHKCNNICMIYKNLYYYFQRSDSIMNTKSTEKNIQKHLNYLESLNLRLQFSKDKQQYQNLYSETLIEKKNILKSIYKNLTPKQIPDLMIKHELKDIYHLLTIKEKSKYFLINNYPSLFYTFKRKKK